MVAIPLITYYYPNLYLSGKTLYKLGVNEYNSGEYGDYEDGDKMKRAAFYFEKAIGKGYHEKPIYSYLTICYWRIKQKADAERVYTLAIVQYPKESEFYFRRGQCRTDLEDYQGAYNDYDSVIKIDPNYPDIKDAYFSRGAMSYKLGDTVNANLDWLKVKKLAGFGWRTYDDYWNMMDGRED